MNGDLFLIVLTLELLECFDGLLRSWTHFERYSWIFGLFETN